MSRLFRNGPFRFSVDIDGRDVAIEAESIKKKAEDPRPLWKSVANMMRQSFRLNFKEGGRPTAWAPLSPNTLAQKMAIGADAGFPYATARGRKRISRLQQRGKRSLANILIAGGQLRDSYVQKSSKDHVERVSKDRVEVGSKHFLAPIHEFGTEPYTIRPKRAPRLRFITVAGVRYAHEVNHPGLQARPAGIVQDEDLETFDRAAEAHLESGP